jgi:thymidylate synthase
MALLISESNVSAAWVEALDVLLNEDGEAVNMTVAIADPTTEESGVRAVVDAFIEERRRTNRSVRRVSTVANTIFPESWYVERLGVGAEEHLYELERSSREVMRRHGNNRRGTYFERFVAWPGPDGITFNQLDQVVTRLRAEHERGHRRGNAYEMGVTTPRDEAIAMPVFVGGRDRQIMSFPCLSHVSFSLQKGVLHMAAIYRNHDLTQRAYGNYIGLGRLLRFVAVQSGWPVGELACLSASVAAGTGTGFARGALTELLADCRRAQKEAT